MFIVFVSSSPPGSFGSRGTLTKSIMEWMIIFSEKHGYRLARYGEVPKGNVMVDSFIADMETAIRTLVMKQKVEKEKNLVQPSQ